MGWGDFRDRYIEPAVTTVVAGPIAGQASYARANEDKDIPVINEMNELYEGITGQTAADAAREAARVQSDSAMYAADIQKEMYDQTRQDQMPWMEAGEQALNTLQEMMAGGAPTIEDYEMSDYASFLRDEGLRGLEAKSRAGGYYNTGASSREMLDYSRNIAGQDYQTYLNNYYQSLNPYISMSGSGQQMATTMGSQGMQSATTQGNLANQAAAAEAAGIVGAANASTQGMQNILGLGMMGLGAYMGGPAGVATGAAGSGFQVPQGWGSYNSGTGFQSAWAQ